MASAGRRGRPAHPRTDPPSAVPPARRDDSDRTRPSNPAPRWRFHSPGSSGRWQGPLRRGGPFRQSASGEAVPRGRGARHGLLKRAQASTGPDRRRTRRPHLPPRAFSRSGAVPPVRGQRGRSWFFLGTTNQERRDCFAALAVTVDGSRVQASRRALLSRGVAAKHVICMLLILCRSSALPRFRSSFFNRARASPGRNARSGEACSGIPPWVRPPRGDRASRSGGSSSSWA